MAKSGPVTVHVTLEGERVAIEIDYSIEFNQHGRLQIKVNNAMPKYLWDAIRDTIRAKIISTITDNHMQIWLNK